MSWYFECCDRYVDQIHHHKSKTTVGRFHHDHHRHIHQSRRRRRHRHVVMSKRDHVDDDDCHNIYPRPHNSLQTRRKSFLRTHHIHRRRPQLSMDPLLYRDSCCRGDRFSFLHGNLCRPASARLTVTIPGPLHSDRYYRHRYRR